MIRTDSSVHQSETPLHWACAVGNIEVVRCLVAKGGDLYAQDKVCGMMTARLQLNCASRGCCSQHGLVPVDYTSIVWDKRDMTDERDLAEVRAYLHTVMRFGADSGTPSAVNVADRLRVRIVRM
mgnify:CR=1 FL=1